MSKEKQIEEMAKAMCGNGISNGNCVMDDEPCNLECVYGCCAEKLYAKGYRKQSEGEWNTVVDNKCDIVTECSVCKKHFWFMKKGQLNIDRMPFCPKCGAKMKGENNEN